MWTNNIKMDLIGKRRGDGDTVHGFCEHSSEPEGFCICRPAERLSVSENMVCLLVWLRTEVLEVVCVIHSESDRKIVVSFTFRPRYNPAKIFSIHEKGRRMLNRADWHMITETKILLPAWDLINISQRVFKPLAWYVVTAYAIKSMREWRYNSIHS
jgi:hypothetical protein